MRKQSAYTDAEASGMLRSTERLLDAYYGYISAANHAQDEGDIEEAKQEFGAACEAYRRAVPPHMQTESLGKMRQNVSRLVRMTL